MGSRVLIATVGFVSDVKAGSAVAHGPFVLLPSPPAGTLRAVLNRIGIAIGILGLAIVVVWLDRAGYRDAADNQVTLLDTVYYATVNLSTTGSGDITPVSASARLLTTLVITPLRAAFLIVIIGTTIEVLTHRTRAQWGISRWRSRVREHTIVVGYGTKGRSAIRTLLASDATPERIVVVDSRAEAITEASAAGHVGVLGDATRSDVLRRAEVDRANRVIVATDRDDSAVLVTLIARKLNASATIVAAVREAENVELLEQSGADSVITSSEAAGRLLGVSTVNPTLATVIEDLLLPGTGLELAERSVVSREVGRSPRDSRDIVVAIVRDGQLHLFDDPSCVQLITGDRLVVVRSTENRLTTDLSADEELQPSPDAADR
jgi:voltage-gated potassium channel